MMDKKEAIDWIKQIQSGSGVDRYAIDVPKGEIAKRLWDDTVFTYGIEYGVIIALMTAFEITEEAFTNDA